MRFLRIRAQNFMSHLDTEVDLSGFDSVVIVGPNGSGKSSLMIDAPLLCLFGEGRSGDIDGFVKNRCDVMTLEFDFSLSDGIIYRIVRKRSKKTARGTTVLEFYQIDAEGNVIRPLTAGTVGDTQSLIKKTLGLDFDTLVRSSIIEQGEIDLFCKSSPSERMELFSKVWDLEKYDDFAQMSRDIWKEASERIKVLDEMVTTNSIAVKELPKKKEELESLLKKIEKQTVIVLGMEKKKGDLQKKMGVFDGLANELARVNDFQTKLEAEIKQVADQHEAVMAKIDRFSKILKNRDVVTQKLEEEKEKEHVLEGLESIRGGLEAEIDQNRSEIDSLRKDYQAKIDNVEKQRLGVEKELSEQRGFQSDLSKEIARLGRKEEQLKQMCLDADKLKGVQCHPDFDPAYVNETCRFIKDAVIAKRKIPEFEESLKAERKSLDNKVAQIDLQIYVLTQKKAEHERTIGKYKEELGSAIEVHEKKIAELKSELFKVESQIDQVKSELSDLKRFTKLLPEISLAEQELPKLKDEEKGLNNRCNSLSAEVEKQKKEKARIAEQMVGKSALEKELHLICNELEKEVSVKEEISKNIGLLEAKIESTVAMMAQVEEDEKEIEALGGKKALYQMLEDAFKQIPYMMVSRGIGAVESLANEILAMISSRGLRVRIETERMAKTTKKIRDEIHLVFEDDDGSKEYKFLSGGEQLRAALAIRLAISEVFAHRRGVRVDSLLADEPFGPLDTEGIEDMKEAMRELRKRFKFLGVITHIERAQDIFPTRLVFERNSKGTRVSVGEEYA
jgi:exonuclease SbcC